MADELTIQAGIFYKDSDDTEKSLFLLWADRLASVTTKKPLHHRQSVGITEEALILGEITSLGWFIGYNRDDTNFIEIRSATGADNDIIKIPPRKIALFHFGSNITAPYVIADTAACELEYLLFSQ